MAIDGNFGVLTMNVLNSIVRIPIKDYIGLLTLTIAKSNVRSPLQFSITKKLKLTNQLLESEWN